MEYYNLTQTGDEVQAYIDSIPVIDVTGMLSGSNIMFATNPYTQIAANYAADCSSVIRLTVAGDVYVIRITGYDSTYYTGSVFKDNQYISVEIGESSAQGMIEDANAVALIPVTGTESGGSITLSSNPFTRVQTAVNAGQHVVVRVTYGSDIVDFTMNTYSASVATYIGTANFLDNEFQLLCSASSAVITNRSTSNTFSTGESVPNVGIDTTPTQGSNNLVTSDAVWGKVDAKIIQSVNLFNKDSDNLYEGRCGTNGYISDSLYRMTHPIKVSQGVSYKFPAPSSLGNNPRTAYCTEDGTFIQSVVTPRVDGFVTFTADRDGWVRANIGATGLVATYMFCVASEYPNTYTPYVEPSKSIGDEYSLGTKEVTEVQSMIDVSLTPFNEETAERDIALVAGSAMTYQTSTIEFSATEGEELVVRIDAPTSVLQSGCRLWFRKADEEAIQGNVMTLNADNNVVVPVDCAKMYLYTSGTNVIGTGTAHFTIKRQGVVAKVEDLQDKTDELTTAQLTTNANIENIITENALPLYCPAPQEPANVTSGSDFNCETVTAAEIQSAFDNLVGVLPRYSSRYDIIGKDCTGVNDMKAYVFTRRNRYAYKGAAALYAWKSGSTIVYVDSCSPRVGDNIYSNTSRTITSSVSSYGYINGVATMKNANNVSYNREEASDVKTELIFSKDWDVTNNSFTAYNEAGTSLGTATSSDGITFTLSGKSYVRAACFDYHTDVKFTIALVANVHGPQSDPMEPSVILYRMAHDLCTGAGIKTNRFLNYLKQNARIIMIPVANPSGILNWVQQGINGRLNANGVNINRNYDTIGWSTSTDTQKGNYPADQAETQYIINILNVYKPEAAYDVHCYGYAGAAGSSTDNASAFGLTPSADETKLFQDINWVSFGIKTWGFGAATPDEGSSADCYFTKIGVVGSTIEMWAGQATAATTDYYNGNQHTPLVMEYCYSMLLNSIKNVWMLVDDTIDFTKIGIL